MATRPRGEQIAIYAKHEEPTAQGTKRQAPLDLFGVPELAQTYGPVTHAADSTYEVSSESSLVAENPNSGMPYRIAQWRITWQTPTFLLSSFFAGTILALGQHFVYRFLHHRTKDDEEVKTGLVLLGRALAYFANASFGFVIVLCYRQRLWRTFRTRALSIRAIDQLFHGTSDVTLLGNWEAIRSDPILVAMAVVVWLLPLATVIASPSALSFGWHADVSTGTVPVPTLNFSIESNSDWRSPMKSSTGESLQSMLFYNTTDLTGTKPGWFDYYDQPSTAIWNMTNRNIFSSPRYILEKAFNQDSARHKYCGGNYNCTFTNSFVGPGYKCENVMDNTNLAWRPFNASILVPEGPNIYFADVDTGAYRRPQMDNISLRGGVPPDPIPPDFGAFKSEPELWIGFSLNTTVRLADNSSLAKNWTHQYKPHTLRCVHYEAEYTVEWNFTGPSCQMQSSSKFIAPIINNKFSSTNNMTAPEDNWIMPTDVARYKKTAAYVAMGEMFRDFLRGNIELTPPKPGPSFSISHSIVSRTTLFTAAGVPVIDLHDRLQALYGDILLTLVTAPLKVSAEEEVLVNRTRLQVTFIYNPVRLAACYAPVILLTLTILCIGAWTIWEDGTTFSTGFSRILATTRNPTLDAMTEGVCLGNDPFPKELLAKKLKFGVLHGNDCAPSDTYDENEDCEKIQHCAFGVPAEVTPIRRGGVYSGLLTGSGIKNRRKLKMD